MKCFICSFQSARKSKAKGEQPTMRYFLCYFFIGYILPCFGTIKLQSIAGFEQSNVQKYISNQRLHTVVLSIARKLEKQLSWLRENQITPCCFYSPMSSFVSVIKNGVWQLNNFLWEQLVPPQDCLEAWIQNNL